MFRADRRITLATTTLAALLAGCAMPILPADSIDAVRTLAAEAPAVDVEFTQDAAHRLVVRYRAPDAVTHLDFVEAGNTDEVFRVPFMKPANDCGALVANGIALRHGPGCEQGAVFVVTPKVLDLDAWYEPAQPSSDGGVLLYTGYYAAVATGLPLRWRFTPAPGDYVVEDGRRHDTSWQVVPDVVYQGPKPKGTGDQREDEAWISRLHARHDVFLGHSPTTQSGPILWVRDPAVPQATVDAVSRAGAVAWQSYKRTSARQPEDPVAIVVLSMAGSYGYHGDRSEGHMLRLSFTAGDMHSGAEAGKFVAHEVAHLWNVGVFTSDQAHPWLHEGDAEWAALNATHDAGLLTDAAFADELQGRIDNCMAARGDHAAATVSTGRAHDDPYGCGVALQLLGFARMHASHPDAHPLAIWGALHRAHPALDETGFAQFFDGNATPMFAPLLMDGHVPFAPAYKADLAAYLPLRPATGEPAPGSARRAMATRLMSLLQQSDCNGGVGFSTSTDGETGEFVVDADLGCRTLPGGAHVTRFENVPALGQPRAAWRVVQKACAASGHLEVGFDGRAPVRLACPQPMPEPPQQVVLPDDVVARLGLANKTP